MKANYKVKSSAGGEFACALGGFGRTAGNVPHVDGRVRNYGVSVKEKVGMDVVTVMLGMSSEERIVRA